MAYIYPSLIQTNLRDRADIPVVTMLEQYYYYMYIQRDTGSYSIHHKQASRMDSYRAYNE